MIHKTNHHLTRSDSKNSIQIIQHLHQRWFTHRLQRREELRIEGSKGTNFHGGLLKISCHRGPEPFPRGLVCCAPIFGQQGTKGRHHHRLETLKVDVLQMRRVDCVVMRSIVFDDFVVSTEIESNWDNFIPGQSPPSPQKSRSLNSEKSELQPPPCPQAQTTHRAMPCHALHPPVPRGTFPIEWCWWLIGRIPPSAAWDSRSSPPELWRPESSIVKLGVWGVIVGGRNICPYSNMNVVVYIFCSARPGLSVKMIII